MNEFDVRIELLKESYGIKTDRELADKLGVSRHTVSTWKERKSLPKKIEYIVTQIELQNALKNRAEIEQINLSKQQIEILQAFDELDADEKEIFFYELKAAAAKARKRAKEVHS